MKIYRMWCTCGVCACGEVRMWCGAHVVQPCKGNHDANRENELTDLSSLRSIQGTVTDQCVSLNIEALPFNRTRTRTHYSTVTKFCFVYFFILTKLKCV